MAHLTGGKQKQIGGDWDTTTSVSVGLIGVISLLLLVCLVVSRLLNERRRRHRRRRGMHSQRTHPPARRGNDN